MLKLIVFILLLISLASIVITKILDKNIKIPIATSIILLIATFFSFAIPWISEQPDEYANSLESESQYTETSEYYSEETSETTASELESKPITSESSKMIIATSQNVLKRQNIKDDISHDIDNWKITNEKYDTTYRWTAITTSPSHKRLKFIYDWDGNSNNSHLDLVYLLVDGDEIVNELK